MRKFVSKEEFNEENLEKFVASWCSNNPPT
jgi:hypothetical protein